MIEIYFRKTEKANIYTRTLSFPDGQNPKPETVEIIPELYTRPKMYSWEKPLHELQRDEIEGIGRTLARLALGENGTKKFIELKRNKQWPVIKFVESHKIPQTASLPWELMYIDDEFVSLNSKTPVCRSIEGCEEISNLTLNKPIKMALAFATPSDQDTLMVEREHIRFVLSIRNLISEHKIEIHEIVNCNYEKLSSALRNNKYDILYFTGHGVHINGMGYLCLEKSDGKSDYTSSLKFARLIPRDNVPSLVFLNCCQSGAIDFSNQYNTFRDVGRELIKNNVPDVIATLTSVFDSHAQVFMRVFFENLLVKYDVKEAMARAREALDSDNLNTFYQFTHLTQTGKHPEINYNHVEVQEPDGEHYFASLNHLSEDMNFVSRHNTISHIETSYLNGVKAVMIYGMGGVGKTALSTMLEKRLSIHYDPRLKVKNTVWLDLRDDCTLGNFIRQISNVLSNGGNELGAEMLKKMEDINPVNVCKLLKDTFGENVLLTFDNCETLLDGCARPRNNDIYKLIVGITAHTNNWKVFLTTREPFDLTIDGRDLFDTAKHQLGSLAYTERAALLENLLTNHSVARDITENEISKIIEEVGGNPFELRLFMKNLTRLSDIDALISETHKETGEYAYLDYYVGRLGEKPLNLMHLLTAFRSPPSEFDVEVVAKALQEFKNIDTKKVIEGLIKTGLIERTNDTYTVPPVLTFYLVDADGPHSVDKQTFNVYCYTIASVYYSLYEVGEKQLKETISNGL